jgi:CRP-like cAMP-binding protein
MPPGAFMKGIAGTEEFAPMASAILSVAPVPAAELESLRAVTRSLRLGEGDHFIRAGEVPTRVGFVSRGLLRIYYIDDRSREFTTQFFAEGRFVTVYANFIERRPTRYQVQALEESRLITVTIEDYRTLLAGDPCWRDITGRIIEGMFSGKLRREHELLSSDAEERYARFLQEYPGLEKRLKQYHVASYLGISPVSLSRIRSKIDPR